jgi:polyisoprenoid-binding protein YceI
VLAARTAIKRRAPASGSGILPVADAADLKAAGLTARSAVPHRRGGLARKTAMTASLPRAAIALAATLTLNYASALLGEQQPLPGRPDTAAIAAGSYQADASHTLIAWRVDHMGFNDYFGLLGEIKATLELDPARPEAATVSARIPLGKILTASAALNSELLRPGAPRGKAGGQGAKPRYFGPNPGEAVFTSSAVKPGADGTSALIEGTLALNGKTRPISLTAKFAGAGTNPYTGKQTLGFHGTAQIVRSDFGLDADMGLVGDTVGLTISAAFERQ